MAAADRIVEQKEVEFECRFPHERNGNHSAIPAEGRLDVTPENVFCLRFRHLHEEHSRLKRNDLLLMTPKKQHRVLSFRPDWNLFCFDLWFSEKGKTLGRKTRADKHPLKTIKVANAGEEELRGAKSAAENRESNPFPAGNPQSPFIPGRTTKVNSGYSKQMAFKREVLSLRKAFFDA